MAARRGPAKKERHPEEGRVFDYISGTVSAVEGSSIVLDVGGLGFEIQADAFSRGAAHPGEELRLYTLMRIADDHITMYGFASRQQKELFAQLTTISGVGPKLAVAILSSLTADEFISAVVTEDEKALQGVSGVGKKTAQRILLEMRGKVDTESLGGDAGVFLAAAAGETGTRDAALEAVEALEGLGYTRQEAAAAVAAVRTLADTAEDLVRLALKRMGLK